MGALETVSPDPQPLSGEGVPALSEAVVQGVLPFGLELNNLLAILAAALLVFVDVMKELPATLVLRPFDSDTLAVVAYQLARDERLGEAALPSLALVLVGLIPVVLLSRTLRDDRVA